MITINYSIEKKSNVKLSIYDILGREVRNLESSIKEKGLHEISWNSLDNDGVVVSAGIYLVKIDFGNSFMTQKITLIK